MKILSKNKKLILLGAFFCALVGIAFFLKPISQSANYHNFADKRAFFSIPNTLNVLSNLPMFLFGILGLHMLKKDSFYKTSIQEKLLWGLFFVSSILVAIFSSFYHLDPTNTRLAFDRAAMSLLFMTFFSIIVAERISINAGYRLLPYLVILGFSSVVYWIRSESIGEGDLRFYVFIQYIATFFALLIILLFPQKYPGLSYLTLSFVFYGISKVCEFYDEKIYMLLSQQISGHTLKHLFSTLSIASLYLYLRARRIKR